MKRAAVSVIALLPLCLCVAACGGDTDSDDDAQPASTTGGTPEASLGWSLTAEQLCEVLSAADVSAAVGEEVTARASNFEGCQYESQTLQAHLSETVFSATEYAEYVSALGAAWVRETEPETTVLAYSNDSLVIEAWFAADDETFTLTIPDGLGESVVLALIAAARG